MNMHPTHYSRSGCCNIFRAKYASLVRYITLAIVCQFYSTPLLSDNSIINYSLYYSLGGGKVTDSAASEFSTFSPKLRAQSHQGASCSGFQPTLDIQDMLTNRLTESLTALTSIPSAVHSALPGSILCRAKPGHCQLLQHYVVRAEQQWNLSVKSCEQTMEIADSGNDPFANLANVSKAQIWEQQANKSNSAIEAKRKADESDGCIIWIAGKKAGCKSAPPIWLVRDTAKAGWCFLMNSDSNCTAAATTTPNHAEARLKKIWPTPAAASDWIIDVVGDYRIHAGDSESTIPGVGLLSKIDEETEAIQSKLNTVVYSATLPERIDLQEIQSENVSISPSLIDALRDLPDRDLLIARISNEIALARIVEKAFLARRMLLSGVMEPNVQSAGSVSKTIKKQIDALENEIERATFEMRFNQRFVSKTILHVLGAHQSLITPMPTTPQTPPMLLR